MHLDTDLSRFRHTGEQPFTLADQPTSIGPLYSDKKDYKRKLEDITGEIDDLQNMMYAHDRYGLLCIFQAMDAAGKDGTIRRVVGGVNPHGVEIHAFKKPSEAELDHGFLWRTKVRFPPRGKIGIFNRSYYEEVLIVRVHPEILTRSQRLPPEHISDLDQVWEWRYEDIRSIERYAHRNGIHVLKFFLNVSKREQARRFLSRLEEPSKNWKFSEGDLKERGFWDLYQSAYEQAISETATPDSPWCVVPADDKRNMRLIVAALIRDKMRTFDMSYPQIDETRRGELKGFEAELRRQVDD